MKFEILYQELTHSTEMIRALLAGISALAERFEARRPSNHV
jgi:hypothetical protein